MNIRATIPFFPLIKHGDTQGKYFIADASSANTNETNFDLSETINDAYDKFIKKEMVAFLDLKTEVNELQGVASISQEVKLKLIILLFLIAKYERTIGGSMGIPTNREKREAKKKDPTKEWLQNKLEALFPEKGKKLLPQLESLEGEIPTFLSRSKELATFEALPSPSPATIQKKLSLEEEVESRLKAINTATTTILTTMGMQVERENKIILLEAFLINANFDFFNVSLHSSFSKINILSRNG